MAIELRPDARAQSIESIRRFFKEELDHDIGELKATLVLDYFLRELAPSIHNSAIEQAQTYMRDRLVDLEAVATEPEFAFWPKAARQVKRRP